MVPMMESQSFVSSVERDSSPSLFKKKKESERTRRGEGVDIIELKTASER